MNYDLNEITQPDGFIHVFGDASFTGKLGVAWVIATKDVKSPIVEKITSTNPKITKSSYASLIGEFSAVLLALSKLPKNQKVRIHTDNTNVLNTLNQLLGSGSKAQKRDKATRTIVSEISKTIAFHQRVDIEYSHDGEKEPRSLQRYYMAIAHNAAAEASNAKSAIKLPDPLAPDQKPRKPRRDAVHNSSDAMTVIDLGEDATEEPFEYPNATLKPKNP